MLQLPRWQNWTIIGVTLVSILLSLPNIIPAAIGRYLPDWYAGGVVNLGLDLRGGVHLVFDVDMRGVVRQRMSDIADSLRPEFRKAQVTPRDIVSEAASVTVTLRDAADAPKAVAAIRNVEGGILLVTTVTPTTLRIEYPPAELARRKQQILDQSIEVVRKRIDSTGTKEPTIQRQGDERILVQVPGIEDPDALIRIVSTTAQMRFHLLDESVPPGAATTPPTVMWRPDADRPGPREAWERFIVDPEIVKRKLEPKDKAEAFCRAQPLNCLPVRKRVVVGGEDLTDAQGTFDPQNSRPIVRFSFTPTGGRAFCRVTTDNVGVRLAILLDEAVISAPNIQQPICGGSGIITGQFTPESTSALALQLRSGALPATLTVIERRTVGADLGADAIRAGTIAAFVGTALVVLFMFLCYGPIFGGFANLAMLVNLLMVLAGMSVLGASLTLPGIAGLVLTVGMAVDSNVLIYERVREEQALGRSPINALAAGYEKAMSSIVDANLTALIAGVLMFGFGSGPIKGFAVTLSLGLLTSMFSATIFTRMVLGLWLRWRRPKELVI